MTPEQSALLARSLQLLMVTLAGGTIAAIVFKNIFNWGLVIVAFLASIIMIIFVIPHVTTTNDPVLIYTALLVFGGTVAADLGGFFIALGLLNNLDQDETLRATFLTIACTFGATFVAALIGLFSGIDFQFLANWLFVGLFVLIGLSLGGLFGWISKRVEWFIGIAASTFWVVYMIFDFNKIVTVYTENSWPAAVHISMSVYLDMINFMVRIAPYIFKAIAASHK
jgi:FtsH-binding integral membrane protein